MEQHMKITVEQDVRRFIGVVRNIVREKAEQCAEEYVASLGLSEDSGTPGYIMTIKNQYKEEFNSELRHSMD